MAVTISGWPGIGTARLVACGCASCANGKTVAIDRYPGLQFPAVFPTKGNRPQHFQASQVIHESDVAAVERSATALQTGTDD